MIDQLPPPQVTIAMGVKRAAPKARAVTTHVWADGEIVDGRDTSTVHTSVQDHPLPDWPGWPSVPDWVTARIEGDDDNRVLVEQDNRGFAVQLPLSIEHGHLIEFQPADGDDVLFACEHAGAPSNADLGIAGDAAHRSITLHVQIG